MPCKNIKVRESKNLEEVCLKSSVSAGVKVMLVIFWCHQSLGGQQNRKVLEACAAVCMPIELRALNIYLLLSCHREGEREKNEIVAVATVKSSSIRPWKCPDTELLQQSRAEQSKVLSLSSTQRPQYQVHNNTHSFRRLRP